MPAFYTEAVRCALHAANHVGSIHCEGTQFADSGLKYYQTDHFQGLTAAMCWYLLVLKMVYWYFNVE